MCVNLVIVTTNVAASVSVYPRQLSNLSLLHAVQDYKQAVTNAFLEVQDILGSLGVTENVVEVPCYDSDELSSPPLSEGSDKIREIDPLLDFSLDDDLVHQPGSEVSGAQIMRNMFEASNALRVSCVCVYGHMCMYGRVCVCLWEKE